MAAVPLGPWDEEPDVWNVLELNDEEWPGFAKVEIRRANKWDDKKAKGKHGGDRELAGVDNAPVKITICFWTSAQYIRLQELMPTVEPVPGKKKLEAIKIGHAVATFRNVRAITVDEVAGPTYGPGEFGIITIDATEHRPPDAKNATGTAKGGGGSKKGQSNCDALADQYAQAMRDAADLQSQMAARQNEYYQGGNTVAEVDPNLRESQFNNDMHALREQQKNAYARAENANSQMQSQGCNKSKPSGSDSVQNP